MFKNFRVWCIRGCLHLIEVVVFEKRLKNYYRSIADREIRCVIDVGANEGQTIDFFLHLNHRCKVYAFEPNPRLFGKLKRKYSGKANVRLFQFGISDKAGEREFYENVLDYSSSFETLNMDSVYLKSKARILGVRTDSIIKDTYPVRTTTLSEFIRSEVDEDVDVLKIDTEGHEFACLVGLFSMPTTRRVKYIQIENHVDDMYTNRIAFDVIVEMLGANSFVLDRRIKHGFGGLEEVIFRRK